MARRWMFAAWTAVLLCGCTATSAPGPVSVAPATPTALGPVSIVVSDGPLDFKYSWPEEAAALSSLNGLLRRLADTARTDATRAADNDARSARKAGYPFNNHAFEIDWETVGNTARLLVLGGEGYVYTGGAHGLPIYDVILWDKIAGKRIDRAAWLLSSDRLEDAAKANFCRKLNEQRAERRGEPVVERPDDPVPAFTSCPDLSEQVLVPVGSGPALTAIRVVIGPYEAGPYSEGTYVVELPMTAAMMAAIAPDYRSDFLTVPN